jgi:hypothetical protein
LIQAPIAFRAQSEAARGGLRGHDALYLPPGHVGVGNEPDTEYIQFSPTDEPRKVSAVIMQNMQGAQAQ